MLLFFCPPKYFEFFRPQTCRRARTTGICRVEDLRWTGLLGRCCGLERQALPHGTLRPGGKVSFEVGGTKMVREFLEFAERHVLQGLRDQPFQSIIGRKAR